MVYRHTFAMDDGVPVRRLIVFERGAVLNGTTSSSPATVHANHDILTGDKFVYAPAFNRVIGAEVYDVNVAGATSITYTGTAVTLADKGLLIGIGSDSGSPRNRPNWDGSRVNVYKDPAASAVYANAELPVAVGAHVGFWSDTPQVWVAALDSSNRIVQVYILGDSAGSESGSSLPGSAYRGQLFVLTQGAGLPDILYCYMKQSADTYDWVEVMSAV